MSRISMPIMNKSGYSMYWNSMWDDKINYSRSFNEDFFLKYFFKIFVEGGFFFIKQYNIENIDDYVFFLKSKYNFHIIKRIKDENKYNYLSNYSKFNEPFSSKIWFLKYQNWVVCYFFNYSFSSTFLLKKKKKFKKISKKYFDILNNYYFNVFKINYNYDFYKNYHNKNNLYSF